MSFDKYCKITLINKIIVEVPVVVDTILTIKNPLGQDSKVRCHQVKNNLKYLKELPYYTGLDNLDEIQQDIKNLTNIYDNNKIKTITINPYDYSYDGRSDWIRKTYSQKETSIKRTFSKYLKRTYDKIYLFPEFSTDGRFHYHGIIFISDNVNLKPIWDTLNNTYSKNRSSKKNTVAIQIVPYSVSFWDSNKTNPMLNNKTTGFDYLTKDYAVMKCLGYKPIIFSGANPKEFKDITINNIIKVDFQQLDKNIIQ